MCLDLAPPQRCGGADVTPRKLAAAADVGGDAHPRPAPFLRGLWFTPTSNHVEYNYSSLYAKARAHTTAAITSKAAHFVAQMPVPSPESAARDFAFSAMHRRPLNANLSNIQPTCLVCDPLTVDPAPLQRSVRNPGRHPRGQAGDATQPMHGDDEGPGRRGAAGRVRQQL